LQIVQEKINGKAQRAKISKMINYEQNVQLHFIEKSAFTNCEIFSRK